MTKEHKKVAIAIGVAVAVWLLFFRKARAAEGGAPSVLGDVTSGHQAAEIETNVLSPNFGLRPGDSGWIGSETP